MFESTAGQEIGKVMRQTHHFDLWMMELEHFKTNRKWIFGDRTHKNRL